MIDLIYGTSNQAKVEHMRKMIKGLSINISSLNDIGSLSIPIDEAGRNPLENARIKALSYYDYLKRPVFSCDSGLYIDGLKHVEQPGVYVRRVNGRELCDDEMIEYYSTIAKANGGQVTARYRNGICLVIDENTIYEYDNDDIASERFIITSKPHEKRIEGFPLDTISIEIATGKYYFDNVEKDINVADKKLSLGFRNFFIDSLIKQKSMIS